MTDLASRTPVEIDTELNRLYQDRAVAEARMDQYIRLANETTYADSAQRYLEQAETYAISLDALDQEIRPLQDEFLRRGMWHRYYLVTNSNGHAHSSTHCATTYPSTSYAWLTQHSGLDRDRFVSYAGEKACTVCFPDAPVEYYSRRCRLTTPEREAREAEKATKKAAAEKSQVVVEGYRDGRSKPVTHTFKTQRGATNALASTLNSMVHYGPTHPSFAEWQSDVNAIVEGLAKVGVEINLDAELDKQRSKVRKDHAKFMKSAQAQQWREQGFLDKAVDEPGYDPAKY